MNSDQITAERLTELETVIERGLQTFVEVGNALMEIRDSRLYLAEHDTFEGYCRDRWGMSRPRAYQLMDAAETINILSTNGIQNLPTRERQARPLVGLTPEQQIEAWETALDTAANRKITAAHVGEIAKNYLRDNRRSQVRDIYIPLPSDACQTPAYAIDPLLPYLQSG